MTEYAKNTSGGIIEMKRAIKGHLQTDFATLNVMW